MRWVVKIGSALLSESEGGLDRDSLRALAQQLIALHKEGDELILVTSGAIAAGIGRLKWKEKPSDLRLKQSAAAVGQLALMEAYEEVFSQSQIIPAQLLLTREDFLDRQRYFNIRNTLMTLLSLRTIPIINENDSVSTEEIQFGDNDNLSAVVAIKVGADRLVLLSDVPGLYELKKGKGSEEKNVVSVVERVTDDMERLASKKPGSKLSTGGIVSKLRAAKLATAAGIETWIASGRKSDSLARIKAGDSSAGTLFVPKKTKVATRLAWTYSKKALRRQRHPPG